MAEITLKFDAKNPIAKKTLDYVLSLGVFKKISGVDQSLQEEKKEKPIHYKNSEELFKPMTVNEFQERIEKSTNDSKNGKVTNVDDLLLKIEKWA
jgi:hypothetical protein